MRIFSNREQAGALLAAKLDPYRGRHPLVLALPRGAVPMAAIIARALDGELSLMLTRKITIPGYEEFAIGAVSESGRVYRNPEAYDLAIDESLFTASKQKQLQLMADRRKKYRLDDKPISLRDRIVILVDDGIATGSTMMAAIQEARSQHPARIIVAAAVAPPHTAHLLADEADELVILEQPSAFYAVGQFFEDFHDVSDQELMHDLWPEPQQVPAAKIFTAAQEGNILS